MYRIFPGKGSCVSVQQTGLVEESACLSCVVGAPVLCTMGHGPIIENINNYECPDAEW